MRWIILTIFLLAGTILPGFAQKTTPTEDVKKSGEILNSLDTLMTLWYVKNATPAKNKKALNIRGYKPDEVPVFTDSIYARRIRVMESPLPLAYNATVKAYIDLYANKKRAQVEKMLGLSATYFPLFEEILDKHKMPLELKYLSIVESALNPRADSRVHATGLWQFMFSTGKLYNLEINSYVDERKDPVKATEAAALLLKDLHGIFGDWFLAMAAYNCGPGNVNKAIRRSGGKRTFWEIYPYLPQETRGYVPAFIAAAYVFQYHQEHNLYPQDLPLPKMVDTVLITREIAFEPISKVLNISVDELKDLNPQYFRDVIPARDRTYTLRLPTEKASAFGSMKDSIYHTYMAMLATAHPNRDPKDSSGVVNVVNGRGSRGYEPVDRVKYTVKSGESLAYIADLFDVSVYSIKRWNHLRGRNVSVGRRLSINVPADRAKYYRKINTMTSLQKKKEVFGRKYKETPKQDSKSEEKETGGEDNTTAKTDEKKPAAKGSKKVVAKKKENSNVEYYTVQKGDTLWSIAQRFPGVTVEDIKRANNISNHHTIKPGQKIKIQKA